MASAQRVFDFWPVWVNLRTGQIRPLTFVEALRRGRELRRCTVRFPG